MIRKLLDQIVDAVGKTEAKDETSREHAIHTATAVLMVDVARADNAFDESEFERVLELIETHFELTAEDATALVNNATETAEDIVSLHSFTKTLHENLEEHDKARIVELLWKVAYADGDLDKYENSLVLKISDLLHVSRGAVMRLKHDAGERAKTSTTSKSSSKGQDA